MAILFPEEIDVLANPSATDNTAVVHHATQHANANDAIEALEAKVGADASAVNTSHDYKLSGVSDGDKAVSLTGEETLTQKTLTAPSISNPTLLITDHATGDIYYDGGSGVLTRLAAVEGKILKISSGVPVWETETTTEDASTTVRGIVEEATLAEIDANTAEGATGARLFINPSTLGKSVDGTFTDNSDEKISSQKAIKTYVDNATGAGSIAGAIVSDTDTETKNVDTVYTLGYTTKTITIYYVLTGQSGSGSAAYQTGIATFDGTTLKANMELVPEGTSPNFAPTITTNAVGVGDGGTNSRVSISILSITSTQFTIRMAFVRGSTWTGATGKYSVTATK